jgi:hypothetical protein
MGRVAAIISPLPKQLVSLVDEGGVLDSKSELQVLPNLSDAKDALNVPAQLLPVRPAATVVALRRRLGMQLYSCGANSQNAQPWIHRSSQKRALLPFPTFMEVEAKNRARSSEQNCRSSLLG